MDLLDWETEKLVYLKPLLELDSQTIPWDQQKVVRHLDHLESLQPTRRRKQKAEESGQTAEFQLAADYTFIAGRHWRLLVMLMIHTGMLGIVVVTGDRGNDVKSVASVLNEIGVGGLNIEIATDNEPYLMDLVAKGLSKPNARAYHWRNISEYRPQAKGVERAVGIAKEGIYTNWLAFEQHCQCRIALVSPLLGYLVGYVYRTFDVFCDQKRSGTPLERLRDSRGGQKPSSFPLESCWCPPTGLHTGITTTVVWPVS